jgi:predicted nucleotidyltransferase
MSKQPEAVVWLVKVAEGLGDLRKDVVFLGGATVSLLVTEPATYVVRPTKDVDVIVEVGSFGEYATLRDKLIARGFRDDTDEDAPLCRWVIDDVKVDVMPTDESVLGFSNRWYRSAMHGAVRQTLERDLEIRRVTAAHFVATKLEAFRSRGEDDYQLSHDLEDIIAVVDGRPQLVDEFAAADQAIRKFVGDEIRKLLAARGFRDALPGHLPGDRASQARLPLLLERLQAIAIG